MPHQTKRQELETRMDELAREYHRTHDQNIKREIENLSHQLATLNHLAVLEDALQRCRKEDVRTAHVYAALDFLESRAFRKWPFDQFRESLNDTGSELWEVEGQWQVLNASLNGIKRAITPAAANRAEPTTKREWVFEPPTRTKRPK